MPVPPQRITGRSVVITRAMLFLSFSLAQPGSENQEGSPSQLKRLSLNVDINVPLKMI